ncbi:TPA: hypothetical protein HA231_01865 [Candidatus Woesearchaeota archaeon]|nr:hypothetical protein [Candidatus Woesearchaeota archaeon]
MQSANTLALQRYGEMPPTGERHAPEVRVDLARTVVSAYEVWRQMAQFILPWNANELEFGYREALRLLGPYARELAGATKRDFDALYSVMAPPGSEQPDGVFVTAAFNLSGLAVLTDTGHERIGYRLSEGKTLIVDNKVELDSVGYSTAGDIALLGDANSFAMNSQSSVQISWGNVGVFAGFATGGVKVNCGKSELLGHGTNDVTLVNYAVALDVGLASGESCFLMNFGDASIRRWSKSFSINEGTIGYSGANIHAVMNLGKSGGFSDYAAHPFYYLTNFFMKRTRKYREIRGLLEGARSLGKVAGIRDRPEEALAMLKAYDWHGLEGRLRSIMEGNKNG